MTLITLHELVPDIMADFIHAPLHRVALAHNTFTDDALALTVRSSEGFSAQLETCVWHPS